VRRINFVYTPKHGSWLNVAECELSCLTSQCLSDRRIGDTSVIRLPALWCRRYNAAEPGPSFREDRMRHLRISIGGMMIAVLLVAANCAVIQETVNRVETAEVFNPSLALAALGIPPMASLLVCSLIFALRGLWKCGESHPFFVGFEMIGMVALVAFVVLTNWFMDPVWGSLGHIKGIFMNVMSAEAAETPALCVDLTVFLLPQLFLAALGGWLLQRLGVKLVIEGFHNTDVP
jgi:hypothetical protein